MMEERNVHELFNQAQIPFVYTLVDRDRLNVLHYSIEMGRVQNAIRLIQQCEDKETFVNSTARSEDTPLKICARLGDAMLDVVNELLVAGAKVNYCGDPTFFESKLRSPLHYAAMCGSCSILEMLLHWGADIDLKDKEGRTAAHLALESRRHDAFDVLRTYGTNVEEPDLLGKTPAQLIGAADWEI